MGNFRKHVFQKCHGKAWPSFMFIASAGKCDFQKCHVTSLWRHQVPVGTCSIKFSLQLDLVPTDQVSSWLHFEEVCFSEMSRDVIMTSSGTCWHMLNQIFFSRNICWPSFMYWPSFMFIAFQEVCFSEMSRDVIMTSSGTCRDMLNRIFFSPSTYWSSFMFIAFWEVCFSEMSRDVIMTSSGTCWHMLNQIFFAASIYWPSFMLIAF